MGDFFIGDVDRGDFEGVFDPGDTVFWGWVFCKGETDLFLVALGVVTLIICLALFLRTKSFI